MLILSRRREEDIVIRAGDDVIVLTVVGIRGDKVRLGLTAPPHVGIDRREVAEAKALAEAAGQRRLRALAAAIDRPGVGPCS